MGAWGLDRAPGGALVRPRRVRTRRGPGATRGDGSTGEVTDAAPPSVSDGERKRGGGGAPATAPVPTHPHRRPPSDRGTLTRYRTGVALRARIDAGPPPAQVESSLG